MDQLMIGFGDIISKTGSSVLTPVLIILVALALRVKPADAIRGGLTTGVGLIGFSLILTAARTSLAELAAELGGTPEIGMEITEMGWNPTSAITSNSRVGIYIVPLYLVVALIMLLLRATRTINIDLWNYWHLSFIGAMVESLTGSFLLGVLSVVSAIIIVQFLSDVTAPSLQKHLGIDSIAIPQGFSIAFAPIALVLNRFFDLLPGLGKRSLTLEKLQKKFGLIADPMILGGVAGGVLAFLAGRNPYEIFRTAFSFAATFYLLPRFLRLLAESFLPIAQGIQAFTRDRLKLKGSLYIGLSSSVGSGSPTVLLTTMILTPLLMHFAKTAPFCGFVPAQSLSILPFFMIMIVAVCRGDIIRSLITGFVSMLAMLYCGTALAGLFTQAAVAAAPDTYGPLGLITSLYGASSPLVWLAVMAATFAIAGLAALLILSFGLAMWNHNRITGKGTGVFFVSKKPVPGDEVGLPPAPAQGEAAISAPAAAQREDPVDSGTLDELIKSMDFPKDSHQ